jgi:hypothetical protein
MSDTIKSTIPRYEAKPNDNHVRGVEIYSHMVWDSEAKETIAYTASEVTALNYAAQMNEKGFIEP